MPTGYIRNVSRMTPAFFKGVITVTKDSDVYYTSMQNPSERLNPYLANDDFQYISFSMGPTILTLKLALVKAIAFRDINPDLIHHLDSLDVLYKDNNPSNLDLDNLVIQYPKEGIYVGVEDYRYIPGYSRYAVNPNGEILNAVNYTKKQVSVGKSGYYNFSSIRDGGYDGSLGTKSLLAAKARGLAISRAVALAFVEYPADVESLHADHINNQFRDNRPENLQWLTCNENRRKISLDREANSRAARIASGEEPMYANTRSSQYWVRDLTTNEVKSYPSLKALKIHLDIHHQRVKDCMDKIHEGCLAGGRYQISGGPDFPNFTTDGKPIKAGSYTNQGREVVVKNVRTGEIKHYPKAMDFVRESAFSKKIVTTCLKNKVQRKLGDYLFQYKDEQVEWIE